MRDNLFEIVTTSRTFYVQVMSGFYTLGKTKTTIIKAERCCWFAFKGVLDYAVIFRKNVISITFQKDAYKKSST